MSNNVKKSQKKSESVRKCQKISESVGDLEPGYQPSDEQQSSPTISSSKKNVQQEGSHTVSDEKDQEQRSYHSSVMKLQPVQLFDPSPTLDT